MKQIGRIIYSYRKLNSLSQEKLADIVGVSSAAVSKWERGVSVPDVDILCSLADYFDITVDDLLGRKSEFFTEVRFKNQADADRFCIATELMECCHLARSTGLIAVEEKVRKREDSAYDFLKFAVNFLMEGFQKKMTLEESESFLLRYAENEQDQMTAKMIVSALILIFSGENEDVVREVLRSFLGRKYAPIFATQEQEIRWRMNRDEKIRYYSERLINVADTGILDELEQLEDEKLRSVLRSISNEEFIRAVAGASANVRKRLFCNLSDRMIWILGEGLINFAEGLEEVKKTQRRLLEVIL